MTPPPSSATQSPTVGKSTWARAANRNAPDTPAAVSPRPSRTIEVSRCTATTRAGRSPSAANGAKASAQPASQPSGSSASRSVIAQPTRFSLPVRLA